MPQVTVFVSKIENNIIKKLQKKWELNKMETILKIIREYNTKIND